jgi:hypothetical protein
VRSSGIHFCCVLPGLGLRFYLIAVACTGGRAAETGAEAEPRDQARLICLVSARGYRRPPILDYMVRWLVLISPNEPKTLAHEYPIFGKTPDETDQNASRQ